MSQRTTFTAVGWDFSVQENGFTGAWYMPENDYPVLFWQREYFLISPPLDGLSLVEMQSALVDAGFTLGSVIYTNSLTVSSGEIIGASVASGCSYLTNAPPVDFYISAGFGGDGSAVSPYPIACEADLQAVKSDLSAQYSLVRNINLLEDYSKAVIVGDFKGVFSGNGNAISDLTIQSKRNEIGLFERLCEGIIIDLDVVNAFIEGDECCGILVGVNQGGVISNCYVQGEVTGDWRVGGLVGCNSFGCYMRSVTGIVSRCSSSVAVNGYGNVGGLVGDNDGGSVFLAALVVALRDMSV